MRIIASRRDDILRRKAEYETKLNTYKAKEGEMIDNWNYANDTVFADVENEIRNQLGDKLGELYIRVERRFGDKLRVTIGNDRGGPRRSSTASLTWSWSAMLDDEGNVKKESSSWSGLEATTIEQINDLKLCVEQLELINTMDWKTLLDKSLPDWKEYVNRNELESPGDRPDFEQELLEADIEDAIGANMLIKAQGGKSFRGDVYYQILRDSGSQYTVREVPASYVDTIDNGGSVPYRGNEITTIAELVSIFEGYTSRMRKANFFGLIYTPIQVVQF